MNFTQIEAFVAVATLGSFSQAAEKLYLSQPTVSTYVKKLEEELGVELVRRSTKAITLTVAGTAFLNYARDIMAIRNAALTELKVLPEVAKGTVCIAASTVPAEYILPELLVPFSREYPEIFIVVRPCDSGEVVRLVQSGECELGLTGAAFSTSVCEYTPFLKEKLALIMPQEDRYRNLGEQELLQVLSSAPFVAREAGSGTKHRYDAFLRALGGDESLLKTAVQLCGTGGVIRAVKAGLGISIVSSVAAREVIDAGGVIAYFDKNGESDREFYVVTKKGKKLSPAASAIERFILNHFSDRADMVE